jgi:hypothetical protein
LLSIGRKRLCERSPMTVRDGGFRRISLDFAERENASACFLTFADDRSKRAVVLDAVELWPGSGRSMPQRWCDGQPRQALRAPT